MKLFEFEAKAILQKHGIPIPSGKIAMAAEDAVRVSEELQRPVFIKSQVTVSGRGKAGGILPASNSKEAGKVAAGLLGKRIKDIPVSTLLVEERLEFSEQFYISVSIDRQEKCFVALVSNQGGGDIEEVANISPRAIFRLNIDPLSGLSLEKSMEFLNQLNLTQEDTQKLAEILVILYKTALDNDAELVEVNPLVKTKDGNLIAADARVIIDDNAIYRHPELAERRWQREEDTPLEVEARKHELVYVDLGGNIGVIGNGAGLVMATLDIVQLSGGKPANFLDIGGGAQVEVIKAGMLLVLSKPEVKSALVNILGGITRCDIVATGIVEGLQESQAKKPVVVRMMGTNEEEGRIILRQNSIIYYPDMEQAAQAAVKLAS